MKTLTFDRNKLLLYSDIGSVYLGASSFVSKQKISLPCHVLLFPSLLFEVPSLLFPVASLLFEDLQGGGQLLESFPDDNFTVKIQMLLDREVSEDGDDDDDDDDDNDDGDDDGFHFHLLQSCPPANFSLSSSAELIFSEMSMRE